MNSAGSDPPLLLAEHISHTFTGRDGEVGALNDVTLTVAPGEFVAIVGPSGSGKTTLLRLLGGLLQPSAGRVLFDGHPLVRPPQEVGFAFQQPTLLPWRSVSQNIMLPLEIRGLPVGEADTRVQRMIQLVGLAGFEEARPETLSGGMQQRVALARALVGGPRLLLLDEPFGSLDEILRAELNLELLRLWEAGRPTVVLVTHDISEAVFVADRVLALSRRPGRIVANVPVELPRPRTAEMRYGPEAQAHVRRLWEALSVSASKDV
ncbi:MAG TPA: ABC transporter ATP-binding protein [Ardenticatenaceae bacterium]|nr:ABC transporter ATP-binding protein [Ardenticatenaceae bacterium]